MKLVKDQYNDYLRIINNRINLLNQRIYSTIATQQYLKEIVLDNREVFNVYKIRVEDLLSNPILVNSRRFKLVKDQKLAMLASHIRSYFISKNRINKYKSLVKSLEESIIPYEVFKQFVLIINREIANYVLAGNSYKFGGTVGSLKVIERERRFNEDGYSNHLDWGTSLKRRAAIKKQGLKEYDHTTGEGIKWISFFDEDFAYWFKWNKSRYLKNKSVFIFIPSNFCNAYSRRIDDFYKTVKSKEDIYNTSELGIVQKLHMLMRFDNKHVLNYINN